MKGFHLSLEGHVLDGWIDYNEHMNIEFYSYIFVRATEILVGKLGIDAASVAAGQPTLVATRQHIKYRRELLLGDQWQVWSGFAYLSEASITLSHRLVSRDVIRAVCDIQMISFCPITRQPTPMAKERTNQGMAFIVPGLVDIFA
jgi:acyl-CoA thioesterase FadM